MIEITYGNNKELARLEGKSIAEVRESYKEEFEIPDGAQAMLNGKTFRKSLESRVKLEDCDELSFVVKGKSRTPVLVTALLIALAVTSGVFAYTYTTASATLTLSVATGDFASLSANATGISAMTWKPFGKLRGTIPAGTLFNVTPTAGYTGDLEVKVYLSNMDELTKNYSFYMMRLQFTDNASAPMDAEGITQVLTMENGVAGFYIPSDNITPGNQYYVRNLGGSWIAYPYAPAFTVNGTKNPVIYAQVTQAG